MPSFALLLLSSASTSAGPLSWRLLLLDTLALHRLDLLLRKHQRSVLESAHGCLQSTVASGSLLLLSSCCCECMLDALVIRSIVLGLNKIKKMTTKMALLVYR